MEARTVEAEFEIDMGAYFFRLSLAAETHIEDDGIGAYEFWGSKGYDVQLYESLEGAYFDFNVLDLYDENGDEIAYNEKIHGHLLEQWLDDKYDEVEQELITL